MKQYFKRSTAGLLCLALLLGLFAGVPGVLTKANAVTTDQLTVKEKNLLADYNPSFEEYAIPGWNFEAGVAQSKDKATDGNAWSLKINVKDEAATSDAFTVAPYWTYNASVKIFGAGKLSVVFYGADGAVVDEQYVEKTTEAWETLTLAAKAPGAAAKAAVKLTAADELTDTDERDDTVEKAVYFDDASVFKGDIWYVPVLPNGGFEEWTAKGKPVNWSVSSGNGYGTFEAVDVEGRGKVISLTKDATNGKLNIKSDKFEVAHGLAYNASIDIMATELTAPFASYQFYIRFYDENGTQIAHKSVYSDTLLMGSITETNEWFTISHSALAPAGAKTAEILLTNPYPSANTLLVDNATFTLATGLVDASYECNTVDSFGMLMGHRFRNGAAGTYVNTDDAYVKDGKQSLMLNVANDVFSNSIIAIPGAKYTATIYIKTDATNAAAWAAATGASYLYYGIKFSDASGNEINGNGRQDIKPISDDWTAVTVTATAPENAVAVRTRIVNSAKLLVYVDAEELVCTMTSANSANLLTNNIDFETRTTGDKAAMTDWSSNKNTDWSLVEYEPGRGYVAHMDGAGTGQQWLYSSTFGDVTPNAKYTLSVDVKTVASTTSWVMGYIEYLDESGTRCDGGYASVFSAAPDSPTEDLNWKPFSGSLTAPSNAAKARILIIVAGWYDSVKDESGNTTSVYYANQSAYIDNVVFSQVCAEHTWPETPTSTTATCVNPGVETYTCSNCGATGTVAAEATGVHSYDDDDDLTCNVCSASRIGISTNVVVGNNLDMLFGFDKTAVADWKGYTVKLTRTYADDTTADERTYAFAQWSEDTANGKYYVTYDGLAFSHMGDEISVQILDASGNVVSAPWTDSIEKYALRRFAEDGASAELKAVLVEMLYFGAAAQKKFDYDAEDLVIAELTDAHSAARPAVKEFVDTLEQGTAFKASNLTVKSHIKFLVAIDGLTEDMSAVVTFTKWNGNEVEAKIDAFGVDSKTGYTYIVMPSDLSAADARETITITIKNADGSEYATCQESIEAYLARQNETNAVFAAFMKYADAAKAYLMSK